MLTRTQLTENSWLDQGELDLSEFPSFESIWAIHPEEFGLVKIYGREIRTPRWQQPYGRGYAFSGINHEALPVTDELQPYLDYANTLYPGTTFDQVLVNWYENGHHYIGAHRDDERHLVPNSPIVSVSLGQTRVFRLRRYRVKGIYKDIPLVGESI